MKDINYFTANGKVKMLVNIFLLTSFIPHFRKKQKSLVVILPTTEYFFESKPAWHPPQIKAARNKAVLQPTVTSTRFHSAEQIKRTSFAHYLVQLWHRFLKPTRVESKSSQLDNKTQAEFVGSSSGMLLSSRVGKARLPLLNLRVTENPWLFQS